MNTRGCNHNSLINELNQGKLLVNRLIYYLIPSSPNGELLIENLRSSFDKALSMLIPTEAEEADPQEMLLSSSSKHSPSSVSSPSDYSKNKTIRKKREMLPRSSRKFGVGVKTGSEDPDEDDYSWRKYGQKNILGAKYQRNYYQCSHRNSHKCMARKQIQRSDGNSSIFDVTYTEKHTCIQEYHPIETSQSPLMQDQKQYHQHMDAQKQSQHKIAQNIVTANLDDHQFSSPSVLPSPSPIESSMSETNIFSTSSLENNSKSSSPVLVSPTTPESNYFSPWNTFGSETNFQYSELDTIFSSNSSIWDYDFALEPIEFQPGFFFDNPKTFN